jgi:hypothetical protein
VIVLWKRAVYGRIVSEMENMAVQPEERTGHEPECGRRIKIEPGRDLANLSHGQATMLVLLSKIRSSQIVILDEPESGLVPPRQDYRAPRGRPSSKLRSSLFLGRNLRFARLSSSHWPYPKPPGPLSRPASFSLLRACEQALLATK